MFLSTSTNIPNEPDIEPTVFVKIPESTGLAVCNKSTWILLPVVPAVVVSKLNVPLRAAPRFADAWTVISSLPLPVLWLVLKPGSPSVSNVNALPVIFNTQDTFELRVPVFWPLVTLPLWSNSISVPEPGLGFNENVIWPLCSKSILSVAPASVDTKINASLVATFVLVLVG